MKNDEQKYQARLIDGSTVDNLSFEEAKEFFYSHAGSSIRPWPIKEYKAP